MRAVLLVLLAGVSVLSAGQEKGPSGRTTAVVRVAAAADLKFVLDEIAVRLESRRSSIRIEATYGSSGSMHAQLRQRAPYDVYLSADIAYPRDLVSRGIGAESDLFTYAVGKIVVWVPNRSALPIARDGLGALQGASRIAVANPRHAPYGRAAEAALRGAELWDELGGKLAFGENVAQAAGFVQSGAADAGIIAKSLALAPVMGETGRFWEVPENAYPRLTQGGLILPWAASRGGAADLRDYLLSREGQQLLALHGFGLVAR
jgi:molybdate transport system substrate-binding protein